MRKLPALLLLLVLSMGFIQAQDDDLPPPTSKPRTNKGDNNLPPDEDFKGFKSKQKVDLSKFIIEPKPIFSIGQGRIDLGLSAYVGYRIWQPKKVKPNAGNVGLFAGGGLTYTYTGFRNIEFVDNSGGRYYANAKWHTYGGGVFLQYNIWKGLFTRVKMEVLHRSLDDFYNGGVSISINPANNNYKVNIPKVEKTIPALLVGVGYNLLQSKNFFLPIMISYNVLQPFTPSDQKAYSLYRTGFAFQIGLIELF